MSLPYVALCSIVVLMFVGCYDVQTNFESCSAHADCIDSSDGAYDYCGQEGQDICCVAGSYKCGCIGDRTCGDGAECYACTEDVCQNGQPTICLDAIGGSFGLERIDG